MAKSKKVSVEPILKEKEEKKAPAKKKVVKKAPAKKVKKPVVKEEVRTEEEIKADVLRDMVSDGDVVEVFFVKSRVPNSQATADKLNKRPKKIAVWEADEGEKQGMAESVRINGAVAWIPKGVSVLVPDVVAKSFKRYQRVERSVGKDIPNSRGGVGIRVDDDEALKNALDL